MANSPKKPINDDKETPFKLTVVKLIAIATALIGGVAMALLWAAGRPAHSPALEQAIEDAKPSYPKIGNSSSDSWGIAHDNPVQKRR